MYTYVRQNPWTMFDPLGLNEKDNTDDSGISKEAEKTSQDQDSVPEKNPDQSNPVKSAKQQSNTNIAWFAFENHDRDLEIFKYVAEDTMEKMEEANQKAQQDGVDPKPFDTDGFGGLFIGDIEDAKILAEEYDKLVILSHGFKDGDNVPYTFGPTENGPTYLPGEVFGKNLDKCAFSTCFDVYSPRGISGSRGITTVGDVADSARTFTGFYLNYYHTKEFRD